MIKINKPKLLVIITLLVFLILFAVPRFVEKYKEISQRRHFEKRRHEISDRWMAEYYKVQDALKSESDEERCRQYQERSNEILLQLGSEILNLYIENDEQNNSTQKANR